MHLTIKDKEGVLEELQTSLRLCKIVLNVSIDNGEPLEAQMAVAQRCDRFCEAIRFITEHATSP